MGMFDDVKKAAFSAVPRKIELQKNIDVNDLFYILDANREAFDVPFKMHSALVKRITFSRHPRLEMQLILTVKGNVVKITPNLQEGSFGTENFQIRTADLKNGFGIQTELNRDDYIHDFVEKVTAMLKAAGY